MLVVTTDELPGYEVLQVLGEVIGATGRLRNPFQDEVKKLDRGQRNPRMAQALAQWRADAVHQMTECARRRGANAVVGMRFDHRNISEMWGEICAYGTAVYVVPLGVAQAHPGSARPGGDPPTGWTDPARGHAASA